jgi:hypothetical protein
VLDRVPEADPRHTARKLIEAAAPRNLLRRIWPFLDELDE